MRNPVVKIWNNPPPKKKPFPRRTWIPSNTPMPRPTPRTTPNRSSDGSRTFTQLCRKLPNRATHIHHQNYPLPWTDPQTQLSASSLDPSDLSSQTASTSDQPFSQNAFDRQTDRQTGRRTHTHTVNRWLEGICSMTIGRFRRSVIILRVWTP